MLCVTIIVTFCYLNSCIAFDFQSREVVANCGAGRAHSPVDIRATVFKNFSEWIFSNYEEQQQLLINNDGHAAKINLDSDVTSPSLSGGDLPGRFIFAQAEIHASLRGSSIPLEIHLIHYNSKYLTIEESKKHPDGLAAIGVFFEISEDDNEGLNPIVKALLETKASNLSGSIISNFSIQTFFPKNPEAFYRYQGSPITTLCKEVVTWTVMEERLNVSEKQLETFHVLLDGDNSSIRLGYNLTQYSNRTIIGSSASKFSEKSKKVPKYTKYIEQVYSKMNNMDHFFLCTLGIIVFFMQCGFAFLEAGAVRSKNTVNILIKNWLDTCLGAIVYWAFGFGLTWGVSGGSSFCGASYFFGVGVPDFLLSKFFFQFTFAATASTIVSGALAERCNFIAYIVYALLITGFIYPIMAHWTWHPLGWLTKLGFYDYAGSGVVHLCGAVCAFIGAWMMGPRTGRFHENEVMDMPGHSVPMAALGGMILVFGFLAQSAGKQGTISQPGDGVVIATAITNTILATAMAGASVLIFNKFLADRQYSFLTCMNGSLTGTVAVCGGCNVYPSWAAAVIGFIAGPVYISGAKLLLKLRIDDPVAAVPVNGFGGILGLLCVPLLRGDGKGLLLTGSVESLQLLGWNIVGMLVIITWTGVTTGTVFLVLKKFKMLRVGMDDEFQGMDILKHGESAYPAAAWVEQQYMEEGHRLSNGLAIIAKEVIKVGLPPNMSFSRQVSLTESDKNNGICNTIMEEETRKKESADEINKVLMNGFTERWSRRQSF